MRSSLCPRVLLGRMNGSAVTRRGEGHGEGEDSDAAGGPLVRGP